ncbi:hypothetical protein [Draconibacterium halophilum]|uniref:Uncharacterized protein n=1 Tax=Draconibacterium halophilum TaxID=2706887 RepID=A0A6C0RB71_9BACT|nr:hypothetical protein [Draconibacterium halophilum]QIA07015.1 hypothetical protein G0Q07_04350 [Draconibacterium halophilum]
MRTEEIKIQINKHKSEMNGQILKLKDQSKKEPDNQELLMLINDLERRRDEIILLYNAIDSLEPGDSEKLSELESSIFDSIRSFNEAYQKSGGFISSERISRKDHHIDFNNPGNTR